MIQEFVLFVCGVCLDVRRDTTTYTLDPKIKKQVSTKKI